MGLKQTSAERAARKVRIDERRRQVGALLKARVQQQEIARQLSVDPGTISRDVAAIRKTWQQEYAADYRQARSEELAVLADDERRWRGEMMRLLQDRTTKITVDHPDGSTETREVPCPPFLDSALGVFDRVFKIMQHRAKLTGIEAPQKVAPVTPDGTQPYKGYVLVSPEDWAKEQPGGVNNGPA